MQSQNRIFDDLVKMMNGVAGTMAGVGREAEASMRDKMREWVGGMDFVSPRRIRSGEGDGDRRAR